MNKLDQIRNLYSQLSAHEKKEFSQEVIQFQFPDPEKLKDYIQKTPAKRLEELKLFWSQIKVQSKLNNKYLDSFIERWRCEPSSYLDQKRKQCSRLLNKNISSPIQETKLNYEVKKQFYEWLPHADSVTEDDLKANWRKVLSTLFEEIPEMIESTINQKLGDHHFRKDELINDYFKESNSRQTVYLKDFLSQFIRADKIIYNAALVIGSTIFFHEFRSELILDLYDKLSRLTRNFPEIQEDRNLINTLEEKWSTADMTGASLASLASTLETIKTEDLREYKNKNLKPKNKDIALFLYRLIRPHQKLTSLIKEKKI